MKKIKLNLSRVWNIVCGLSSIVSIFVLIFGNKDAIIFALIYFCVSLSIILYVLIRAIFKYTKIGKNDKYARISTDIKYETLDGYKINYETYRIIQSKSVFLDSIEHGFKWSGTKPAKISSNLQKVGTIKNVGEKGDDYDTVNLIFNEPLLYNENCVVHFKAELDDSDEKSETMISYKVSSYAEFIHFRVILKYKPDECKEKAKVYKRRIKSDTLCKEIEIATIPFDNKTKSFEFLQERPDIGFYYILRWNR